MSIPPAVIRLATFGALALITTGSLFAQNVIVRSGAIVHINQAQVSARCHDMNLNGQLTLESGQLTGLNSLLGTGSLAGGTGLVRLSGDLSVTEYHAQQSELRISDACQSGPVRVFGSREFHDFYAHAANGRMLIFDADSTHGFSGSLRLSGAVDAPLLIRTTLAGEAVYFDLAPGAFQDYSWIDVADNHALGAGLAPGPPERYDAIDSGNLMRWFELDIFRDRFQATP